ncbi:MAG: F0F1 ATP synthase subunit A [Planctomycetes bacterium]|nr:F0F1 ATP synthase subunit A [Planctomycetota bacterium]
MSANPADHVKDIPLLIITKNGEFKGASKVSKDSHGSTSVDWGVAPEDVLGGPNSPAFVTIHSLTLIMVSFLLIFGALHAVRGIRLRPDKNRGVWAKMFELFVQFIRDDVARPNLGPHGGKYVPVIMTFFFLILFCNLWGMIPLPWPGAATGNINVTAALATIVLVMLFGCGMYEQGVFKFWKNIVPSGVPVLVLPLIYAIEVMGPFIKCFALCARLLANMVAGHIVLAALMGLAFTAQGQISWVGLLPGWFMSVAISALELFVAFLQAYVFVLLTSIFLGSFIHPEH